MRGIDHIFKIGTEILIAYSAGNTIKYLTDIPEEKRCEIGESARKKLMGYHTAAHRATELEAYYKEAVCKKTIAPKAGISRQAGESSQIKRIR